VSNPKSIKELLKVGGKRLSTLTARASQRNRALELVCAALPAELAGAVVSAGMQGGKLVVGVSSGAFATRLRYATDALRQNLGSSLGATIESVRIKVVPPPP
jgi:hypothetical protein